MNIVRGGVIGLAGAVGAGVLAFPAAAAFADAEQVYAKRDELSLELVAVNDDDGTNDDRGTRSGDRSPQRGVQRRHREGPVLEQQPRGRLGGFKSALAR